MTDSTSPSQRSGPRAVAKAVGGAVLVLAIVLGAIAAIIGVASLVPGLGPLSTVAFRFAPTVAPLVALVGLIFLVVGIIAVRRGRRRTGTAATVLGGVGSAANIAVIIVLVGDIVSAGGYVNLFLLHPVWSAIASSRPDITGALGV